MVTPNRTTKRSGFTLIELMVTVLIAGIAFLAIANVMADSIRGYRRMYTRIHGNIVNDAYFARLKFDSVCRRSSRENDHIYYTGTNPDEVTVLLYSNNLTPSSEPDRYATFYPKAASYPTDLMLDTGTGTYNTGTKAFTKTSTSTATVAQNVMELKFSVKGKSVQMTLTLDDGEHGLTVVCSSIRHN